jgi:formylglycine-generating enzyme required for sulfatase activity
VLSGYESIEEDLLVDEENFIFSYEMKKEVMVPLIITSDPKGATVFIDNVRMPNKTPLSKYYPKGNYKIRIEKDKYLPFNGDIMVAPPKTEQNFNLIPNFGKISINSLNQKGLSIFINDKSIKRNTPSVIDSLLSGEYQIYAQNNTWMTDTQTVNLKSTEDLTVNLNAYRTVGDITVKSNPSNLPIYMNSELTKYYTPHTFIDLPPAEYSFYVKSNNMESEKVKLTLQKGEQKQVELQTERLFGDFTVKSNPSGLPIYIYNNTSQYTTPYKTPYTFKDMALGDYTVFVKSDKLLSETVNFTLHKGESKQIELKTDRIFGVITVSSNPSGIPIYMNNQLTEFSTPHSFINLNPAEYTFFVKSDRFESGSIKLVLKKGEQKQVDLIAERIYGEITVTSSPSGLPIYMNNKLTEFSTPHTFIGLMPDEYIFYAKSPIYTCSEIKVGLNKGKSASINLTAERQGADLMINSIPAKGMTVYLNNFKQDMQTPCTLKNLKPGQYTIELKGEFYLPQSKTIIIEKGVNQTLDFTMPVNCANLKIETVPEAEIEINGAYYGKQRSFKFEPQLLEIKVVRSKEEIINETVILKNGDNISLKLMPNIGKGTIQVEIFPTDAVIELKGETGEVYTSSGMKIFESIPFGNYDLSVKKRGYKSYKDRIKLKQDQTITKSITLIEGKDIVTNLIFVQGGSFQMGSNAGNINEKPIHSVTVRSFYLGKYEVTQKEWNDLMISNKSKIKADNNPVEQITWIQAIEFCNKKSKQEGLSPCYEINGNNVTCDFNMNGYRLPTEAEWEYAARGGNKSKGFVYSGSNDINLIAWNVSNSKKRTHKIGSRDPNELGIYDMTGNVYEWCWDWSGKYRSDSLTDPTGVENGSYRIFRGGSCYSEIRDCTVTYRSGYSPFGSRTDIGFRLARSIP